MADIDMKERLEALENELRTLTSLVVAHRLAAWHGTPLGEIYNQNDKAMYEASEQAMRVLNGAQLPDA